MAPTATPAAAATPTEIPATCPLLRSSEPLSLSLPVGAPTGVLVSVAEVCVVEIRVVEVITVVGKEKLVLVEGKMKVVVERVGSVVVRSRVMVEKPTDVDVDVDVEVLPGNSVVSGKGTVTMPLPPGGGSTRVAVMVPCVAWIASSTSLHIRAAS